MVQYLFSKSMIFLKKDDKICVLVKSPFLENTVCAAAGLWDSVFPTLEVLVQVEKKRQKRRQEQFGSRLKILMDYWKRKFLASLHRALSSICYLWFEIVIHFLFLIWHAHRYTGSSNYLTDRDVKSNPSFLRFRGIRRSASQIEDTRSCEEYF